MEMSAVLERRKTLQYTLKFPPPMLCSLLTPILQSVNSQSHTHQSSVLKFWMLTAIFVQRDELAAQHRRLRDAVALARLDAERHILEHHIADFIVGDERLAEENGGIGLAGAVQRQAPDLRVPGAVIEHVRALRRRPT